MESIYCDSCSKDITKYRISISRQGDYIEMLCNGCKTKGNIIGWIYPNGKVSISTTQNQLKISNKEDNIVEIISSCYYSYLQQREIIRDYMNDYIKVSKENIADIVEDEKERLLEGIPHLI